MKYVNIFVAFLLGCSQKSNSLQTPIRAEMEEFYTLVAYEPRTGVYEVNIDLPASKTINELNYTYFLIAEAQKEAERLCQGSYNIEFYKTLQIQSDDYSTEDEYYRYEHSIKSEFKCKTKLKVESL